MSMNLAMKRQQGLSLVELMVALTLGLILTAGLVQIFSSNRQGFELTEASGRVQEAGRIGVEIMSQSLRNAGYWGCNPDKNNIESNLRASEASTADINALITQASILGGEGPTADVAAAAGTDWIELRGVGGGGDIRVDSIPSGNAAVLKASTTDGLQEGDIIVVSDCSSGHLIQVTQLGANNSNVIHSTQNGISPGNEDKKLPLKYEGDGFIYRPGATRFFVAEDANGNRSLMQATAEIRGAAPSGLLGSAFPLVSGVQDMQIQIGVDSNNNGAVTANEWMDLEDASAANRERAEVIRFSLLVRSASDNVVDQPMSYCYPGFAPCAADDFTTAPDNALYRVYVSTENVRNISLRQP